MITLKELFEQGIKQFNSSLMDNLDYDFSSVTERIDTFYDFEKKIIGDFKSDKKLFYRGERIYSSERRLIPTMLRDPKALLERSDYGILHIDSQFLFDQYSSMGGFVELYNKTMGTASTDNLYEISAFAQHYCNFSPLIDFSKSLFPALSFALKGRKEFEDDIVLYVLELKNDKDYTKNPVIANKWLRELSIYLTCFDENDVKNAIKDSIEMKLPLSVYEPDEVRKQFERLNTPPSPTAKLIDVPTNTRMKFQQGVFLLLTDFNLLRSNYLTKNIRDKFIITKYIISKELCPKLVEYIDKEIPWYSYECLMDVEGAFKAAINKKAITR